MQFHPILASNVLPLVVRGLVALRLWCPHLLIDIDCLARRSTLACRHTRHHVTLHTHIGVQYTQSSTDALTNTITCLHTVMHSHPNAMNTTTCWTNAHKNTHIHTLSQTLAAGMAKCTNAPTLTHPLNLYTQKPRVTTSLSAVKPRNYDKPLPVFILPFLTMHYPHHLPCSHLPSNLEWSHFWVTWLITLRSGTCWRAITTHRYGLYLHWFLLCVGSPKSCRESRSESL